MWGVGQHRTPMERVLAKHRTEHSFLKDWGMYFLYLTPGPSFFLFVCLAEENIFGMWQNLYIKQLVLNGMWILFFFPSLFYPPFYIQFLKMSIHTVFVSTPFSTRFGACMGCVHVLPIRSKHCLGQCLIENPSNAESQNLLAERIHRFFADFKVFNKAKLSGAISASIFRA